MYYIKNAMGKLEKMGRKRLTAQAKCDSIYGPNKYRVFKTSPDYRAEAAIIRG